MHIRNCLKLGQVVQPVFNNMPPKVRMSVRLFFLGFIGKILYPTSSCSFVYTAVKTKQNISVRMNLNGKCI